MTESIPPAIEFPHFTMGMGLINSSTENRMSRDLFDQLKRNSVYGFLIKNLNFKTALDAFHLRPYVLENKVKDELQNEGLYKEYMAMSLMDILAKGAAGYLNKDFYPEYRAIVVNISERAKYANVLREASEFSNLRLRTVRFQISAFRIYVKLLSRFCTFIRRRLWKSSHIQSKNFVFSMISVITL
jgi:hypothetical protein